MLSAEFKWSVEYWVRNNIRNTFFIGLAVENGQLTNIDLIFKKFSSKMFYVLYRVIHFNFSFIFFRSISSSASLTTLSLYLFPLTPGFCFQSSNLSSLYPSLSPVVLLSSLYHLLFYFLNSALLLRVFHSLHPVFSVGGHKNWHTSTFGHSGCHRQAVFFTTGQNIG